MHHSLALAVVAAAVACAHGSVEGVESKAQASYFFLGRWAVQDMGPTGLRKLALNFTASSDEWTLVSPVSLAEGGKQIGHVSLSLEDGEWVLSATSGILTIPTAPLEEADLDGEFVEVISASPAPALHEVLRFTFAAPPVDAQADGSHLLASARGSLAPPADGTFQLNRAPGTGTHATVDDARFRSVVGDTFTLTLAATQGDTTWTARKLKSGSESGGWMEDNKMLLMGALFIGNIAVRLWSKTGRAGAEEPKPTIAGKRAQRKAGKGGKGRKKD